jgi:hypothetical protein
MNKFEIKCDVCNKVYIIEEGESWECPECGEPLSLEIKKWGGKRNGAGRKPSGKSKKTFYITDDEYAKLKKYLEELRE